jgi:hypothetical protein
MLPSLRSLKRLRTWVGPKAATCGWTFAGPAEWAGFLKWNDETKRYDQAGEEGLVGYMKFLAVHDRPLFVPLLGKVLPYHAAAAVVHRKYRTEDEVRQLCAERGIPFESMLDLAIPAEEVLELEAEDGDE